MKAEWLTKTEIALAVAGGYRDSCGHPVWIEPHVAREIAERVATASAAKAEFLSLRDNPPATPGIAANFGEGE
jgi:hypothetical protein